MTRRILVAYASEQGATAGVADAIGQVLAAAGAQVDVRRVQDVTDVTAYDAAVIGSAIHGGAWLPEAMQFIQAHGAALSRKPCAAFLVCMTMAAKSAKARAAVPKWMEPVRALLKPVSEGFFAGALDIGTVPSWRQRLLFRISVALGVWAVGDHRDWNAIRTWASGLVPLLAL